MSNQSSFTSTGHSIRLLKQRASALKTERGCTHNEALDEVARLIGYPNWMAAMSEPADADRDEFFGRSYERNDRNRPDYREFLTEWSLDDSADAFRKFLVEDYARFKALGFHRYRLDRDAGDPDELLECLKKAVDLHGPEALLPQRLSDELLERLIGHARLARVYLEHVTGPPLPPTGNLDPIVYCVIHIIHQQKRRRHPRASALRVKLREAMVATETYHMRLELEFLSRRTKVRCDQPTLESVLVPPEAVAFWVSSEEG
jgi:hypothetical protein